MVMRKKPFKKVRKGVILAAGFGTRFLPVTKAVPKELLPVGNKPVLQYLAEEMAEAGIEEIIFVISREKEMIKKYFTRDIKFENYLKKKGKYDLIKPLVDLQKKVKFSYVYQDQMLGNGHALLCAKKKIGKEPFAFSDGDSIIASSVSATKQILEVFYEVGAAMIGVQKINNKQDMTKYGNVYTSQKSIKSKSQKCTKSLKSKSQKLVYKVEKIIEKPDIDKVSPQGLIIGGMRYVMTADFWPYLERQGKSRLGEIWVADAVNAYAQDKDFYSVVYEGKYLDTGTPEALFNTTKFLNKKV